MTFVVENVQNAKRLLGDQIQARLIVVEFDHRPANLLSAVFLLLKSKPSKRRPGILFCIYLLQFKYVLIEIVLKILIGIINTSLFKTIDLKILERERKVEKARRIDSSPTSNPKMSSTAIERSFFFLSIIELTRLTSHMKSLE